MPPTRPAPPLPSREVVCGLLVERGEEARQASYERSWERDHAVWRAVTSALEDAASGARPARVAPEPPGWLARIVQQRISALARGRAWQPSFVHIRTLERLGLVELPVDDDYVLAAVGVSDRCRTRAELVRADPELVDRVLWRMFEIEGGGEISLANVDKYDAVPGGGWQDTFVELTADGLIDRERVLVSALEALGRDFSAYRAGWYSRLYDALKPTLDELQRHEHQLRGLLRSGVPATVSFALGKLVWLHSSGLLDAGAAVPALVPAVLAKAKGTALTALRLAVAATGPDGRSTADLAELATAALQHPHADVQQAAAVLLVRLGAEHVVRAEADHLEPTVRQALGFAPATPSPADAPPSPTQAVMPRGASGDDVLDRMAALLEDASDALELEVVLGGLAGIRDATVLRPLSRRAGKVLERGAPEGVTSGWLRGHVARLVLLAAGQSVPRLPAEDHTLAFLVARMEEVGQTLSGGAPPHPLLATPDDGSGWLRPGTFVDRLLASTRIRHYDLVGALLRLHPEDRGVALQRLVGTAALSPHVLAASRYALGDHPPTEERRRLHRRTQPLTEPALWVAASRTRSPLASDLWLESRGERGGGRSQPIDCSVHWRARPYTWRDHEREHNAVAWLWTVAGQGAGKAAADEPTCLAARTEGPSYGTRREQFTSWLAMTYPHDAEHFLHRHVDAVLNVATSNEVDHDAVLVLDALLRHPGRLGPLARTALAAGLSGFKADQRARAVDAVHALHGEGRLDATALAEGLRSVVGPATLTRWASSLRDLAAIDPRAARLVIDALADALPAVDPTTQGVYALLDLLHEELLRVGSPTPPQLTAWLRRFQGASRSAKTAAALLQAR